MPGDLLPEDDAERVLVYGDQFGGPVDPPDEPRTLYGTVTGHADATQKPILPGWLRNPDQRGAFVRDAARLTAHRAGYHATRSPKYLGRVLLYAPLGVFTAALRLVRWAWDLESWSTRQNAASRNDVEDYLRLSQQRDRRHGARIKGLFAGLSLAVLVIVLFLAYTPRWAHYAAGVVLLVTCAWVGRPPARPIVDRVTIGQAFIKLTADMVRAALIAAHEKIKDPGAVTFVRDIYRDGPGWAAYVNLPPGVIAADIIERRDRLAAGLRLPKMQVWPAAVDGEHPGQLRVWVADKPVNAMKAPAWPLLTGGQVDYFAPFPYGFDEQLRPVTWRLDEKNSLFGGIPGSGKSLAVRIVVLGAILDPLVIPVIFELKGTGDFDAVEPLCPAGLYGSGADDATKENAYRALLWLLRQCDERGPLVKDWARTLGTENKVTRDMALREPRLRPVLAVIDEVQELFTDKEVGKHAVAVATAIVKRGRALGIHLILATQRIDKESIPRGISSNIGIRLALACTSHIEVDLVLGTGAYARGARSTEFEPGPDSGWGYRSGLGRLQPIRAAYVDNAGAARVVRRAIALRKTTGYEQAPRVRVRSLLDDVRAVWPLDLTGWWLADILAALQALDDTYTDMDTEALSAALRAAGMKVEPVHRKVGGKGTTRHGLQRASLPNPQLIPASEDD